MLTFNYWLGATIFAGILTIPGWPWLYQKNPVNWLKEIPSNSTTTTTNTKDTKSKTSNTSTNDNSSTNPTITK